jgi:hypothetical protein
MGAEHGRLQHNSMHVKDFRYLRMTGVVGQQDWEPVPKSDTVWHIQFPDNAIAFRCKSGKGGEIIIQETVNVESTSVLRFKQGAHVIILGNTFIYFELDLDKPNI